MAMEVNGNYRDYKNDYWERLQEEKDKTRAVGKDQEADKKAEAVQAPIDEYISSEQSGSRPSGLYRMGQDENGNPKVLYDDPKKVDSAEKVTANTDKVDREIEKLKKQKQQLEQQIREASGDEEKIKDLEKKLSQVERELSQKDNDTYRRQHTVFY
ncbi:MAG: hypothetical protein HDR07_09450 [Lachnospiraceae bacterium]|nr:hypothetical protein [Lachnospiraceae bacterium]